MKTEKLKLNLEKLPMIIELEIKGIKKNYVIKTNKDKNGIFINKLEQY